ncbi:hypothetical protein [Rhodococcus opacus]|uniref:hypothetical protein n=1 Tax=Rhodococcus opacus TaxID=37919 RepID=UPI0029499CA7|nr:hypothetical protein [Rhodococcus opacus]MDV6244770.1 hypothetical protein [Rhodococcus opacus]
MDLKKRVRYATYGLSDEAYNTVHMLSRFGLITLKDPMPNRRSAVKLTPLSSPTTAADSDAVPREAVAHDAHDMDDEESNERVPYRLIYPSEVSGVPQFKPALETVLATLAL